MHRRSPQRSTAGRSGRRRTPAMDATAAAARGEWLYGRQPVTETLRAGKRHFYEALIQAGPRTGADLKALQEQLAQQRIPVRTVTRQELDELCREGNHQGIALRVGGFPYGDLAQVTQAVRADARALVLLLDHLEDPQNLGALLRTADAAGVTAVILPQDRAAGVTAAAVRASAGAAEHLCVVKVVNLVRVMQELKDLGLWLTGLEMADTARALTTLDFTGPVGLVVGSEGRGLTRLVKEHCDLLAYLPMLGRVNSLNAGVAGAIALYEVIRQRQAAAGRTEA